MANRSILKPRRLVPGDRIGVVVPSSPFDRQLFEKGVAVIEAMGFSVVFAEGLFEKNGYLAGTDEARAAQIHRFFQDPEVAGIICARGGYGSLRLLSLLDFDLIARHPKVFVGFSDASVLLQSFYRRSGLFCFHGPMVTSLATGEENTVSGLRTALTGEGSVRLQSRDAAPVRAGRAEGPVCGGNLTVLCHMLGTPYAPCFDGHLLFFEDVGEAPYRIDRMLTQMRLAGAVEGVRGVVLGDFDKCGEPSEIRRIVAEAFPDDRVPILSGIAAGHGKTNMTLPIGPTAVLDADGGVLQYQETATADR